jgi:hypothetical protein
VLPAGKNERHSRTVDATRVANGIYEDQAFDRLPILSDALEETGCETPTSWAIFAGVGRTLAVAGVTSR